MTSHNSVWGRSARRVLTRRDGPLTPQRAAARLSAYVYGTILALAAVVVVDPGAIEDGTAVLIVLGTTASTFLAHVFAETVGHSSIPQTTAHLSDSDRRRAVRDELRDALPIASAGSFPSFFLLLGWLGVLTTGWAFVLAGAGPIVRIALIQVAARRLSGERLTLGVLVGGIVTAAVEGVIVVLKVVLTH